jgi:hypothetical protein
MKRALQPYRPPPPAPQGTLQDIYVDDLWTFGSHEYLVRSSAAFTDAARVAGDNAVDVAKHDLTDSLMSLGWAFLDQWDAVLPNPKGWFTLLNVFFREIPWNLQRGDRLPNRVLMRVGSYAARYSRALLPLRAYVQGFYGDIGTCSPNALRTVSAKTVQDLWMWRVVLRLAADRPSLMATPPQWPVIHQMAPEEQAAQADLVVYVDACTTYRAAGVFVENVLCAQFVCPAVTHYVNSRQEDIHINYLEMMSVVGGALIAVSTRPDAKHIHIWCDNTTSVSWSQSNRVTSPLACYFTQTLSLLGATRKVLLTVGWVAGVRNPVADSISRFFQVTDGPQFLSLL